MKAITVQIPEEKLEFFIELMGDLGFEYDLNSEIPVEHQQMVLERMKYSNPKNNVSKDTFFDILNEKLKHKTI
ncbi:hypothetical protein [Algoriphagus sp. A40]|uniref:hypothetical protein n=1 Tax=Algoriphagus sp. A40 TaxID=1945863 RepID=UPI0009854DEE|nr:hypothetical protein [Algoriphagus sp. A40]OOG75375.1 hypothetical protein B0E43_10375 [Algoriphagus sp. A40]